MSEQMSIDADAVGYSINTIEGIIIQMKAATDKFAALLEEKVKATDGKFALLKALQEKILMEVDNCNGILETQESLKEHLRRYISMAEEVDDASAFR